MRQKTGIQDLYRLFIVFFKAGTFTFAGGLAMLPVIQRDVVERYKFMPEDDFIECATLAQTLPGVIALNCAVFVGRRCAGTVGMLAAGFGAVFSAFILMIAATASLQLIPQQGPVAGALQGVRAAAAAFILAAAFTIGRHNVKNAFAVIIMMGAFVSVLVWKISAVAVVIVAGVAGYGYQRICARRAANGGGDA